MKYHFYKSVMKEPLSECKLNIMDKALHGYEDKLNDSVVHQLGIRYVGFMTEEEVTSHVIHSPREGRYNW